MNVSWLRNYVSVAIELHFVDIFTATILIGRGCSTGGAATTTWAREKPARAVLIYGEIFSVCPPQIRKQSFLIKNSSFYVFPTFLQNRRGRRVLNKDQFFYLFRGVCECALAFASPSLPLKRNPFPDKLARRRSAHKLPALAWYHATVLAHGRSVE